MLSVDMSRLGRVFPNLNVDNEMQVAPLYHVLDIHQ